MNETEKRIVIRFDPERQMIEFDLEGCTHAEAQGIILSVAAENHRLVVQEMEEGPHD